MKKPKYIRLKIQNEEGISYIDCEFLESNEFGIYVIIDGFELPTFYSWEVIQLFDVIEAEEQR